MTRDVSSAETIKSGGIVVTNSLVIRFIEFVYGFSVCVILRDINLRDIKQWHSLFKTMEPMDGIGQWKKTT